MCVVMKNYDIIIVIIINNNNIFPSPTEASGGTVTSETDLFAVTSSLIDDVGGHVV